MYQKPIRHETVPENLPILSPTRCHHLTQCGHRQPLWELPQTMTCSLYHELSAVPPRQPSVPEEKWKVPLTGNLFKIDPATLLRLSPTLPTCQQRRQLQSTDGAFGKCVAQQHAILNSYALKGGEAELSWTRLGLLDRTRVGAGEWTSLFPIGRASRSRQGKQSAPYQRPLSTTRPFASAELSTMVPCVSPVPKCCSLRLRGFGYGTAMSPAIFPAIFCDQI